MRLVQVTVPAGKLDAIQAVLESEGIDYVVAATTEDPDYAATVFFPLPTEAVEPVLEGLESEGVGEEGHSVIVQAESVVSTEFEELREEYRSESDVSDQVAFEELRTHARELIPTAPTYALLTAISAVVATAGLLLGSTAIVVGAMIIAPLVGPSMATSVGSVVDDEGLFRHGLSYQAGGFLLAVASATLFGLAARELFLVPPTIEITGVEQIAGRLTPDLLSLVVAIGSGVAGARSLSSDVSTTLVGVMISAALVPPAAAVGIGVAWWRPAMVVDAGLLLLVNAVSINLAALATLWYSGARPRDRRDESRARVATRHRLLALVAVALLLTGPLVAYTGTAYFRAADTQAVRADVAAVADEPAYADVTVLDAAVEFSSGRFGLSRYPEAVVVTVARPGGQSYPDLAERIRDRVASEGPRPIDVQVRFVDVDRAGGAVASG